VLRIEDLAANALVEELETGSRMEKCFEVCNGDVGRGRAAQDVSHELDVPSPLLGRAGVVNVFEEGPEVSGAWGVRNTLVVNIGVEVRG